MRVFGRWKEVGEPEGNPGRHGGERQLHTENHYTTVSPTIQYTILDLLVLEMMTHHLMSKEKNIKREQFVAEGTGFRVAFWCRCHCSGFSILTTFSVSYQFELES